MTIFEGWTPGAVIESGDFACTAPLYPPWSLTDFPHAAGGACPYCASRFAIPPRRATDCPACGNLVYVWACPDGERRLLTSEAMDELEAVTGENAAVESCLVVGVNVDQAVVEDRLRRQCRVQTQAVQRERFASGDFRRSRYRKRV